MNVNSILNSAVGNSAQRSSSQMSPAESADQKNMFMTLLVAQLKNQDPLEPQDGTQFVAQLSQFNSLDQLISIRQSMEQLVAAIHRGQHDPSTKTN